MKFLLALLATLISLSSVAGPSVFNLNLGSTDITEFKKKYKHRYLGFNKYSQGEMYEISPNKIDFNGLKEVTVIFDTKKVLVAVLSTFNKDKFDYLESGLSNKYQVKSRKIPFVGDKLVEYQHEGSFILLDAPHMSFELSLNYLTTDFMDSFEVSKSQKDKARKNKEINQL